MREDTAAAVSGRVVATFGRRHEVEDAAGRLWTCVRRGRQQDVACGDLVGFTPEGSGQGVIERVEPRSSLLYRSDAFRQKVLAANADLAVIVVAGKPMFSEQLLTRCLAAAAAAGIEVLIACNKQDLPETAAAMERLAYYQALGIPVLPLCARQGAGQLAARLAGHTAILVGESGMGKSTLINALVPAAASRTGEISDTGGNGRHTTTAARRYALAGGGAVIDSPGMQVFGLQHVDRPALEQAFAEFAPLAGRCRFADCRHGEEPDCRFKELASRDPRAARRLAWMREILAENGRVAHWARPPA